MLIRFMPLAITRVDGTEGCVGAVMEGGSWVRPQPVSVSDLTASDSSFCYFRWTTAELSASREADARPEDRQLTSTLDAQEFLRDSKLGFLRALADPSVADAFAGHRSLGMLRVRVHRIYARRSTGGRVFLRAEFSDPAGHAYDWIIPELSFGQYAMPFLLDGELDKSFASALEERLRASETYFVLGLTKPNHRFPGKFRGCHPLIVGIHSFPGYNDRHRGGVR